MNKVENTVNYTTQAYKNNYENNWSVSKKCIYICYISKKKEFLLFVLMIF